MVQNEKTVYSDGKDIEAEILQIVKSNTEKEIESLISDDARYLINNTFSPVRRNLLDWYPFKPECTILEVGAGMGSLTSLLCGKAKQVVAVEMSDIRANIIRERNKDKENLTVYTGDILNLQLDYQFDYIVMVGVLEYAAIFGDSEYPHENFLRNLTRFLKEDGVLLFAIENRFGLKYWIGGSEEHLQRPFVGIQGYPDAKGAKTFSKADLTELCKNVGLESRFYYLLPDYKFPTAIFTDESLPDCHDVMNPKYAYTVNSCLVADERTLYRDIIKNNVFPFFANSYLVEAARTLPERYVVRVSARGEVKADTRVLTVIDNHKRVFKMAQTKEAVQHIKSTYEHEQTLIAKGIDCVPSKLNKNCISSEFVTLPMANQVFARALEEGDTATVTCMIDVMKEALQTSSSLCTVADQIHDAWKRINGCDLDGILERGYMDMTFYNSFWNNGRLIFFDQEWDFKGIPLLFILYYGIKVTYGQTLSPPQISMSWLCKYLGISEELAQKYDRLEAELWSECFVRIGDTYGADGCYNQFNVNTFNNLLQEMDKKSEVICEQERFLKHRQEEVRFRDELIQQKDKVIEEQQAFLSHRAEEVAYRDEQIQQKNKVIEEQQAFLSHRAREVEYRDELILNKDQELEKCYEKIQHQGSVIYEQEVNLNDKQVIIDTLELELTTIKDSRMWKFSQAILKAIRFFRIS